MDECLSNISKTQLPLDTQHVTMATGEYSSNGGDIFYTVPCRDVISRAN